MGPAPAGGAAVAGAHAVAAAQAVPTAVQTQDFAAVAGTFWAPWQLLVHTVFAAFSVAFAAMHAGLRLS
eukprot:scaffold81572_cov19-Tisochrysis_lutea.AAC.3